MQPIPHMKAEDQNPPPTRPERSKRQRPFVPEHQPYRLKLPNPNYSDVKENRIVKAAETDVDARQLVARDACLVMCVCVGRPKEEDTKMAGCMPRRNRRCVLVIESVWY